MWRCVPGFLLLLGMVSVSTSAYGELVYTYQGERLSDINGSVLTPDDFVSGYVRFNTEPTPGGTFDASHVASFQFSVGPLTVTSNDESILSPQSTRFAFDSQGDIFDWFLVVGQSTLVNSISIYPAGDDVILDVREYGSSHMAGFWQAVPEPSPWILWSVAGFAAGGISLWSRRNTRLVA